MEPIEPEKPIEAENSDELLVNNEPDFLDDIDEDEDEVEEEEQQEEIDEEDSENDD